MRLGDLHEKEVTKKKILCSLLIALLVLSFGSSTIISSSPSTNVGSPVSRSQSTPAEGLDLYIEESLVCYIEDWQDNATSIGVENAANIIGEPDGLTMNIVADTTFEYAMLKVNGSIMSDYMWLRGCVDTGGDHTGLHVYSWMDPYTEPDLSRVYEFSDEIRQEWNWLVSLITLEGEVLIEYSNTSIEYILLVGRSDAPGLGTWHSIDAIEVHGYTNVMADEQNDGIPDIWQYSDVVMYDSSIDVDLFGHTWGVMGLVGVAAEGSSNLDFLTPFIKLGVVEPEDVDETHFYVICQCELTTEWNGTEDEDRWFYYEFLESHDLMNWSYIQGNETVRNAVDDAFGRYMAFDGRIRTYHVIDYTVDGTFDPHNYYGSQGQINAEYNTLDTKTNSPSTAQEKFDLDVSIVLDIVENVMDAVLVGGDLTEQFMSKIAGFIQGKIMDGVGKALLEKITKKALKSALKAILSITTIKDIVVKGSKILEKLGVTLPDWLRKARDFVESIPFIDPPVELWKVRLTFVNETTGLPVLGYDYINNLTIDTHPQGIYFGDTYSAQVILSSRDIFPVIGRIQSVNGSRTLTGNLYVEDFGLLEATRARSSLEPGEAAQGRMYTIPPNGSVVISQCQFALASSLPTTVEIGGHFNVSLSVSDENGTLLSDIALLRAAINNMPNEMVELPATAEADGSFTLMVNTGTLGVTPDDHMIAALYKPAAMFHDYWNFTFVLQDTVAPTIQNVTAAFSADGNTVSFSARVTDHDLNASSVVLKTIDGSTDVLLAVSHAMTYNGSHFIASLASSGFSANTIYYRVEASDNSGNSAQSTLTSIRGPALSELGPLGVMLAVGVGVVAVAAIGFYYFRRPGR